MSVTAPVPVLPYRGRFAPSPTGLLHAGSLTTAVGSYLEAKRHGGEWWLRMEDLDPPREMAGAADAILRTLQAFGFEWDGELVYQHDRHERYRAALAQLVAQGDAYGCGCTRKEIAAAGHHGADGMVYPGTCRHGVAPGRSARAWRLRVDDSLTAFHDRLQGEYGQHLQSEIGDFVLLRADGFWAYQLAVVVDDIAQGMTDIVRGADLLVSTPRQLWLRQKLGGPAVTHCHLPLMVNAAGEKLSKQTLAPAIDARAAAAELRQALTRLGHAPPAEAGDVAELWQWARSNWQLARVPPGPIVIA
ncbi:tRNA glutamyl-Q(34) synthetase GluQRS [Vogesella indigofera]|uniref:tRNA glutamyl-Q(34) synthetase GluQRS n=1 Tax=Vogesella indigofera TaxID=45465 RepID=UPI00234C292B|nr:tRNA glutamyl-Q(34) synthetase GluQRS [Vogesella indigofera]MDC7705040.1 tRNA glutamyl-Q(34) synthetase GluQRS [Vogesella indigofera]